MKLYVDQMFHADVAQALRSAGHDVVRAAEVGQARADDEQILARAGLESVRERTPMTPFPAPNRLHVWWARRPLVASRAAVLASLLPADADREKFLHMLGIHGDPVAAKVRIAEATRDGVRLGKDAYGYPSTTGSVCDGDRLTAGVLRRRGWAATSGRSDR
jgi:hypothetical protein